MPEFAPAIRVWIHPFVGDRPDRRAVEITNEPIPVPLNGGVTIGRAARGRPGSGTRIDVHEDDLGDLDFLAFPSRALELVVVDVHGRLQVRVSCGANQQQDWAVRVRDKTVRAGMSIALDDGDFSLYVRTSANEWYPSLRVRIDGIHAAERNPGPFTANEILTVAVGSTARADQIRLAMISALYPTVHEDWSDRAFVLAARYVSLKHSSGIPGKVTNSRLDLAVNEHRRRRSARAALAGKQTPLPRTQAVSLLNVTKAKTLVRDACIDALRLGEAHTADTLFGLPVGGIDVFCLWLGDQGFVPPDAVGYARTLLIETAPNGVGA